MNSGIPRTAGERQALLAYLRRSPTPDVRPRAHLILLRVGGDARATITAVLPWSRRTVARWQPRFLRGRVAGPADRDRAPPPGWPAGGRPS